MTSKETTNKCGVSTQTELKTAHQKRSDGDCPSVRRNVSSPVSLRPHLNVGTMKRDLVAGR